MKVVGGIIIALFIVTSLASASISIVPSGKENTSQRVIDLQSSTAMINYSTVDTNNSQYWQGYTPTTYANTNINGTYVLKSGDTITGNLNFTSNQGLGWKDPDGFDTLSFGSYIDGLAIRLVNAFSAGGDFLIEPSDATFWRNTNSIWMGLAQGLYIGSGDPFMSASFVEMVFFDTQSNTTTFSAENSKVIVNGNVNSTRVTAQQFCNVTGSCINNWNYGIGDVTSSIGNATYLKIDGTNTMTSNFDGGLNNVTNVSYVIGRNLRIGTNVQSDSTSHVAGTNSNATINSVALGNNANASDSSFAFACQATKGAVCLGSGAIANTTSSIFPPVAIGKNSYASSSGVAIGNSAKARSPATVAIGTGSIADQGNCVAIGGTTNCNTTIAVVIGVGLVNSETRSVQLGISTYSLKINDTGVFFNNGNLSEITRINTKKILFLDTVIDTCNTANEGLEVYNFTLHKKGYCNSTDWVYS